MTRTEREDIMTDFQFRAIMSMVLDMLNKCKTPEDIENTKRMIEKLSSGKTAQEESDG